MTYKAVNLTGIANSSERDTAHTIQAFTIAFMDKELFVENEQRMLDVSYTKNLDGGELKYPIYLSVMFTFHVFCVAQLLSSDKYAFYP